MTLRPSKGGSGLRSLQETTLVKVDTGAEGNVISLSTYKSLFPNASCNPGGIPTSFTPSNNIITAFGGRAVGHHGTCVLKLDYGGSCKSCPFHVVDANGPTILRLPKCTNLNLVTMIDHEFQHHKL